MRDLARRVVGWGLILLSVMSFILMFIDEPLRGYAERQLNRRLQGYIVRVGGLSFHPMGLSLDLNNLTVSQDTQPDPAIAQIATWHASIHWRKLLAGQLVSDHRIDHPVVHLTKPQVTEESGNDIPLDQQGWQEAVLAVYPLKINQLTVIDGEITYRNTRASKPLHASHVNVRATNIRNVRSKSDEYPSDVHVDAVLFETGALTLDGRADFLSEPHLGMEADVRLQKVNLLDVLPFAADHQLHLTEGLLSTTGHIHYSPRTQVVRLQSLNVSNIKLDFVHSLSTAPKKKGAESKVALAGRQASNDPTLLLRIDEGRITNGEFGFVNKAIDPMYRVFLTGTNIVLENWSNPLTEGTALVKMRGMLMGTGDTQLVGVFRPETNSPDFTLSLRVWKTQIQSPSHVLRAYGDGLELASGVPSVSAEMRVKNGQIEGYMTPLFNDVKVYDPEQDSEKGLSKKNYKKMTYVASHRLKNAPHGEVATKAALSGLVENSQAGTWEMAITLLQNAFFDAVLPGFERKDAKR